MCTKGEGIGQVVTEYTWNYSREGGRRFELFRWRRWWLQLFPCISLEIRCGWSCCQVMRQHGWWRTESAASAATANSISNPSSSTATRCLNAGLYKSTTACRACTAQLVYQMLWTYRLPYYCFYRVTHVQSACITSSRLSYLHFVEICKSPHIALSFFGFITARRTLVQSAVLRSHVVCLSVRPSPGLSAVAAVRIVRSGSQT